MAKARVYEFITGIEASAQPDAGTPTLSNDIITKGYADANFSDGTAIQEAPSGTVNGSNVTFTLSQTPSDGARVLLWQDGLFQRQGTDYTISSLTITMATAPETGQTLDAFYIY